MATISQKTHVAGSAFCSRLYLVTRNVSSDEKMLNPAKMNGMMM